jgi:lysophospholipase L1-like esterase
MHISCLGDSIRIQYTPRVIELLGNDFSVFAPKENCRFAKYTLRGMFDWKKDMHGSRIVHFNNGLWDICDIFGDGMFTSEAEYVETMLRIAKILQSRHEIVIFATTTPVSPKNPYNKNEDIRRYNERIVPLLKERGILINDLYSTVAADLDRYISSDTIHLTPEGIERCAVQVADCIRSAASMLSHTEAVHGTDSPDALGAPIVL